MKFSRYYQPILSIFSNQNGLNNACICLFYQVFERVRRIELPWPAWEIDRIYISPTRKTVTGIPPRVYGLFPGSFLDENGYTIIKGEKNGNEKP